MTLVELLVAMVVSLLVALAAVSALTVARRGFMTVDAASQLRDNARYTIDMVNRLVVQAGYPGVRYATSSRKREGGLDTNPPPNVFGFNNATPSSTDPLNSATTRTAGSAGYGSDVLILRYQADETFPGSGVADGTMITCLGSAGSTVPLDRDTRMISILYVAPSSSGELALMCRASADGVGAPAATGQPLVDGVENFQVLYGVDGVTPGTATATTAAPVKADRYLRADQLTVTSGSAESNAINTNNNWRRVRSIRIGMVLRGPPNSAQQNATQRLYPFGVAPSGSSPGGFLSSSGDAGTVFDAPADGRLRQVVTFTIHLRNYQDLS